MNESRRHCGFSPDALLEYAIGENTPQASDEVASHLVHCVTCRAEIAFHRSLAADLRTLSAPEPPADLEEVLVRAAIQARRSLGPGGRRNPGAVRRGISWTPILCGAVGLAVVAVFVLFLLPGRMLSPESLDDGGFGRGRGTNVFGDTIQLLQNLRQGWEMVSRFLTWISPVSEALGAALAAVGVFGWSFLGVSFVGAALLLRRLTRSGQKKGTRHVVTR